MVVTVQLDRPADAVSNSETPLQLSPLARGIARHLLSLHNAQIKLSKFEEREQFEGWLVALQAVPTIRDLLDRAESIRRSAIDRFAGRLGLTESQLETLEQLTNSIVNKLMHEPISRLRDETDREAGLVRLEEARSLFGLDGNDLGSGDPDEEASE